VLTYHETVGSAALGTVYVKDMVDIEASDVLDDSIQDFSIVTSERTYHLHCHSPADCQARPHTDPACLLASEIAFVL
jgi:hypothetical protein